MAVQSFSNMVESILGRSATTVGTSALALIHTRMQRPQLLGDQVPGRRLLNRLCAGCLAVQPMLVGLADLAAIDLVGH
jgi:hypothetical protein